MFILTKDELIDFVTDIQASNLKTAAAVEEWIKKNGLQSLSEQEGITEPDQLTQGQTLAGLNFNPSNIKAVDQAKRYSAALYDLIVKTDGHKESELKRAIRLHATGEILNAKLNVVNLLTFKD